MFIHPRTQILFGCMRREKKSQYKFWSKVAKEFSWGICALPFDRGFKWGYGFYGNNKNLGHLRLTVDEKRHFRERKNFYESLFLRLTVKSCQFILQTV